MRLFVPAERDHGELRVGLVPESVAKLTKLGLEVVVQSGAGAQAHAYDADYIAAGAAIDAGDTGLSSADVVVSVRRQPPERLSTMKRGAVTLSFLQPVTDIESVRAGADAGLTMLSFDLVPRISRAQSMDALTSQALVTGYRAALVAADRLPKFFPLFMTAAGTIPPAKVLVLGAGVAGLQAIATARRLGAVVSAYDVRPSSADEVKSMGATFVTLELEALAGAGGYAREMTEERAARQRELLTPYIRESDAVITTAAVPGRRAPLLVTADMVKEMRPGSVVVDLASETGGNVEGSVPGEEVMIGDAVVWGGRDVASQMPVHASKLYSANVVSLLTLLTTDGIVSPTPDEEIVAGCAVVLDGEVRNPAARSELGMAALATGEEN